RFSRDWSSGVCSSDLFFAAPEAEPGSDKQQIKQTPEVIPLPDFQKAAVKVSERVFFRHVRFRATYPKGSPAQKLAEIKHRIEQFLRLFPHFFHVRCVSDLSEVLHRKTDVKI